jgi:hypothetical protein
MEWDDALDEAEFEAYLDRLMRDPRRRAQLDALVEQMLRDDEELTW